MDVERQVAALGNELRAVGTRERAEQESLTRGTETTSPTAYTFLKGDRSADGGRR